MAPSKSQPRSKSSYPNLPVIFGGWHPSLLAGETLNEPFVDAVVRGQGEITLAGSRASVGGCKPLDGINGLSWKRDGAAQHNPERRVQPLESLPTPAFDLVDFDAYERACGVRKLAYATSVGCPYACNYCTDMVFYKRRFNALSAERVAGELAALVTRYRIEEVALLDSNFPVDLRRALRIAAAIKESGVKFRWTFQASTDFLCRMSEDEVRLLGESGVSHMGFGTESTSEDVLKLMNKRHQRVDEMFETARKANLAGIRVTFNLIFGYPGRNRSRSRHHVPHHERNRAAVPQRQLFAKYLHAVSGNSHLAAASRAWECTNPSRCANGWTCRWAPTCFPGCKVRNSARLQRMLEYFLLNSQIHHQRTTRAFHFVRRGVRRIVQAPVGWRLRRSRYAFPWELWLARSTERLVLRRSFVTGQELPKEPASAC